MHSAHDTWVTNQTAKAQPSIESNRSTSSDNTANVLSVALPLCFFFEMLGYIFSNWKLREKEERRDKDFAREQGSKEFKKEGIIKVIAEARQLLEEDTI